MHHYNDNDPFAARWLVNLVTAGRLPAGAVSQTDIKALKGDDLRGYDQVHLFAGIGGWPLALRMAGWPDSRPVWTGSCPCQPFSVAGKGKGEADDRHLWPYFRELIAQCRPPTVFGEQVASKAGRLWLDGLRLDLEKLGYAVGSADLCAAGVNAPHIRQRLYWVAHPEDGRREREQATRGRRPGAAHGRRLGDTDDQGPQGRVERGDGTGQRPVGAASMGPHGLELAAGDGCEGGPQLHREHDGEVAASGRLARRVADANGGHQGDGGLQRGGEHGQQQEDGRARGMDDAASERAELTGATVSEGDWKEDGIFGAAGFWSPFDLIPCRDGKARRVEPGTFPLAHGVPGRVGLLRGYGNAIVPPLAAEFVRAYLETE